MPAIVIVIALGVLGGILVVAGTYMVAGQGVTLLLSGALLFLAALFVRSGMRADG